MGNDARKNIKQRGLLGVNMRQLKIHDLHSAIDYIKRILAMNRGEIIKREERTNQYRKFGVPVITDRGKYFITFKRSYYKLFSEHFKLPYRVEGQIANKELMIELARGDFTYIVVMPDTKVYEVKAKDWMDYYNRRQTDVPHLRGEIAYPMNKFIRWK